MSIIPIGTVVRDPFGRVGIVCKREPVPPDDWIDERVKADEIKKLGEVSWFGVMPFGGGYVLFPEPMLERLRKATYEDFLSAVDGAGVPGRASLAKIFPDFVDRLLRERHEQGGGHR
jgi:hypothetical protein